MPRPVYVTTSAPAAGLRADPARRTITGQVVPWETFARVSTGQLVAFERGALRLSERSKLILDHDATQPVAVFAGATDGPDGLDATFRVPAGPRGDQVLAEAADGLRDGFSVGADIEAADERDDGSLWITAALGRHVALLSEPAFDSARVTAVAASTPAPTRPDAGRLASGFPNTDPTGGTMPAPATVTASTPTKPEPEPGPVTPEPPAPAPAPPDPAVHLTAAGAALPVRAATPAVVRDPYPYALGLEAGGPSFVRDAWAALETPGSGEADRWRRAQAMADDPAHVRAGMLRFTGTPELAAATGTSTGQPSLTPDRWEPGRYVPMRGAKAPLYTVLAKYPTPDFNTLQLPRTESETGLSGLPADEVTPIAPGDVQTEADVVNIEEVEGAYLFSRKLLMGSNPAIDRIASDAMDRAWLADVEARAVAYFIGPAHSTAWASTYADGLGYINALRGLFAAMAAGTLYTSTDALPAALEYQEAAAADDTTGRGLLPYGPRVNSAGSSEAAYASLEVQGVPLWPGPYMPADKTVVLDQSVNAAACFATPVMNFRLEWTTDAATGGNVKVLKLSKYSGIGFWAQYIGGIHVITNSTPLPGAAGAGAASASTGSGSKAK
jgi:phage head maturation protease